MSTELIDDELNEVERYEQREGPAYRFQTDRREFVAVLGAGLVIAVSASSARAQRAGGRGRGGGGGGSVALSRRFHIDKDGMVTTFTSKVEVGQGSRTELTQAVAEELFLPIEKVQLVMADTELCPDDGGTAGSATTPRSVPSIRRSAAQARELLAAMAATRLGVERSAVAIADGVFSANDKKVTLGELASAEDFSGHFSADAPEATITPVDKWRVMGTPVKKVTGRDVVTGSHRYASDVVSPGMLHGKVLRPAAYGATLKSIDLKAADAFEGVSVVRDGDFVGCTAPTTWLANKAIEALAKTAEWDVPSSAVASDVLFDHLKKTAKTPRPREWGDGAAAIDRAAKKCEAAFHIPYIQHAPMEPRAAVAEWTDSKLTVWTGSQQPSRVKSDLTQAMRVSADNVRVIIPDTGGGFGGKHSGEAAVEAARLAKAAGKPVSLRWTREEEFTWAYCRPGGLIEVQAGIDDSGKLVAWDFANYNSGASAIESPYESPNGRTRFFEADSPLRQGSYRGLASTANTFARESAIDELAHLAGLDPLEFRLKNLPDGRLKDVLKAAVEKFNWRGRPRDDSNEHGVGLACGTEKGSFVAACVAIHLPGGDPSKLRVTEICEAFECGAIVNPVNLRAQVAGAIVQGLGGALWEQMQFKDGRVTNGRFSEYRVPRMDDLPPIDVVLVDRKDEASLGAGETPIIAVAPAIANAIHQATGKRLRSLPLTQPT